MRAELEYVDANGNTPLLLAYRMGRTKAARMLLAAGAFSKARSAEGYESVIVAALTANPDLTREAVIAMLAETDAAFERRIPNLLSKLEELPDFELTMTWQFSSWVPLVSQLLPSDTYTIRKRGSSMRFDTTLLGMTGLKWERGSISLVLWGKDMPKPGASYVLDNDMKTAADARMAFTHPQDIHIQDWVRKLLTQKQKTTDFWSRDALMTPVYKQGLFGRLTTSLARMTVGDGVQRGRVSQSPVSSTNPGSPKVTSPTSAGEGGSAFGSFSVSSPTNGAASTEEDAPNVHIDDPRQATEDVGLWTSCSVYEMKNLCVRDLTHAPIMPELKLKSWWKPEYSRQATDADFKAAEYAAKSNGSSTGAATTASASSPTAGAGKPAVASAAVAHEEAPEKLLVPLFRALKAIKAGKINENNANSATIEELEGMGFEDDAGKKVAGHTVDVMSFQDYFGFPRPQATAEEQAAFKLRQATEGTTETPAATPAADVLAASSADSRAPAAFVGIDGSMHKAMGAVAKFRAEATTVEDKSLDLKVFFSKEFPISVRFFHRMSLRW
jgi:hypothetical protein